MSKTGYENVRATTIQFPSITVYSGNVCLSFNIKMFEHSRDSKRVNPQYNSVTWRQSSEAHSCVITGNAGVCRPCPCSPDHQYIYINDNHSCAYSHA